MLDNIEIYEKKSYLKVLFYVFVIYLFFILNYYDINTVEELSEKINVLDIIIICMFLSVLIIFSYLIFSFLNGKKMLKFDLNKKIIEKNYKKYSMENRYVCIKELVSEESDNIYFLLLESNTKGEEEIKIMKSTDYEKICLIADYFATLIDTKVVKKNFEGIYSILDFSW